MTADPAAPAKEEKPDPEKELKKILKSSTDVLEDLKDE